MAQSRAAGLQKHTRSRWITANPLPEAVAICRRRVGAGRGSSKLGELPDLKRMSAEDWAKLPPKVAEQLLKSTRGHVARFASKLTITSGSSGNEAAAMPRRLHRRNERCPPEPPQMVAGHGRRTGLCLGWSGSASKKDSVDIAMDRGAGLSRNAGGHLQRSKPRIGRSSYAMTALGLLSLASIGHQPSDAGKIGSSMGRALILFCGDPRRRSMSILDRTVHVCTATALPPCA